MARYSVKRKESQFVGDLFDMNRELRYHGTFIITHRDGRVSNVSYADNSEREIHSMARAFFFNNSDVVRVELPKFNVVYC